MIVSDCQGARACFVGPAAPQIDHRLTVHRRAKAGAHFVPGGKVGLKSLAQRCEAAERDPI